MNSRDVLPSCETLHVEGVITENSQNGVILWSQCLIASGQGHIQTGLTSLSRHTGQEGSSTELGGGNAVVCALLITSTLCTKMSLHVAVSIELKGRPLKLK